MAHIGFVSTSVLESKDGIDYGEEKRKDTAEVLEAERIAKEGENKPLWQQLAGRQEEKQAKYDAVRAAMFAPPKALDDEESTFLQGVEAQRLKAKNRKEEWEQEELRGFALARANQTVTVAEPKPKVASPSAKAVDEQKAKATILPPPVVAVRIKTKRKHKDRSEKRPKKRSSSDKEKRSLGDGEDIRETIEAPDKAKGEGRDSPDTVTRHSNKGNDESLDRESGGAGGLSGLLGQYGDGSSDSDEA